MPHVVLNQKIDLERLSNEFKPVFVKEPILLKIENIFVDKMKRVALIPTVVIDEKNQKFLIEISTRDEKTTIRLFPGTDPEKTNGVKSSLGYVTRIVQKSFNEAKITKTNIEQFLAPNLII